MPRGDGRTERRESVFFSTMRPRSFLSNRSCDFFFRLVFTLSTEQIFHMLADDYSNNSPLAINLSARLFGSLMARGVSFSRSRCHLLMLIIHISRRCARTIDLFEKLRINAIVYSIFDIYFLYLTDILSHTFCRII